MLVKLSNDWFDGQTFHKKGVAFEYQGKEEDLPNGAVILSEPGGESNDPLAFPAPKKTK